MSNVIRDQSDAAILDNNDANILDNSGDPRIARVTWAELQVPLGPRQARITWAEAEVPLGPRRAYITWAETEGPIAPGFFTVPTYQQPIDNRLGDYGVEFPVSFVVVISPDNSVTTFPGVDGILDEVLKNAKVGSGDGSKAIFRQGRTYLVDGLERELLAAAGYTVVPV